MSYGPRNTVILYMHVAVEHVSDSILTYGLNISVKCILTVQFKSILRILVLQPQWEMCTAGYSYSDST